MATLSIQFTPAVPAPKNGHRVRYRPKGATAYTTVDGVTSSPLVVPGLPDYTAYEGDIASSCATLTSAAVPFEVPAFAPPLFIRVVNGTVRGYTTMCLGNQIYVESSRVDVTLVDALGATVVAREPVLVSLSFNETRCYMGTSEYTMQVEIGVGKSSTSYDYLSQNLVDCGQSSQCEPEYMSFNNLVSISPDTIRQAV